MQIQQRGQKQHIGQIDQIGQTEHIAKGANKNTHSKLGIHKALDKQYKYNTQENRTNRTTRTPEHIGQTGIAEQVGRNK